MSNDYLDTSVLIDSVIAQDPIDIG
jgi:hypothetical protein